MNDTETKQDGIDIIELKKRMKQVWNYVLSGFTPKKQEEKQESPKKKETSGDPKDYLRPFGKTECDACGSQNIKKSYRIIDEYNVEGAKSFKLKLSQSHLHCKCQKCGYGWLEKPKDKSA